jgi:uncharacterized membrane protein YfhO
MGTGEKQKTLFFNWIRRKVTPGNLLVFLAPFLFFILPLVSGKVLVWGLPTLQFIPWRVYAYDLLSQGVLPLWNPLNGMGAPLFANYQSALLYPPGMILYLFYLIGDAPWIAWGFTLLVPFHLGWGGLGLSKVSKSIGLDIRGQVISGLAFGLCGYFIARAGFFSMIWAGVWLPWLVWSAENLIKAKNKRAGIKEISFLGLAVAMQLLAGHAQLTWYSILLTGFWVIIRSWAIKDIKSTIITMGKYFAGLVVGVAIAMVQLAPTFEYLMESHRSAAIDFDYAMTFSFWPWQLLTFLFPGIFGNPGLGDYWGYGAFWEDAVYIGFIPIILVIMTFYKIFDKKNKGEQAPLFRLIIFLWLTALIGVIFALGKNTVVFPWLYKNVPTFDMFQAPARWMLWTVFSFSLLAGIGANHWKRPAGSKRRLLKLFLAVSLATIIGAIASILILPDVQHTFIRAFIYTGTFGIISSLMALKTPEFSGHFQIKRWEIFVVSFILLDLLAVNIISNPFGHANLFRRNTKENATSEIQNSRVYIPADLEYRIKFKHFFLFTDFTNGEKWVSIRDSILPNLNLLDHLAMVNNFDPLLGERYTIWMEFLDSFSPSQQEKWLGELSVGTMLVEGRDTIDPVHRIPLKGQNRINWSACSDPVLDGRIAFERKVLRGSSLDIKQHCIIVESVQACGSQEPIFDQRDYRIKLEQPDKVEIEISDGAEGWLLVADTWYPGWQATIDGKLVEIARAEYLFRGICVPQGDHQVVMEYKPNSFYFGMTASIFGLIIIIGMFGFVVLRKE